MNSLGKSFIRLLCAGTLLHHVEASAVVLNVGPSSSEATKTYFGSELSAIKGLVQSSIRIPGGIGLVTEDKRWKTYLEQASVLSEFSLDSLDSRNKKISFWVNVYNAMVLHGIRYFCFKNFRLVQQ
jgi:hypothetical protein